MSKQSFNNGKFISYTKQLEPEVDLIAVLFCPPPLNKFGKIYSAKYNTGWRISALILPRPVSFGVVTDREGAEIAHPSNFENIMSTTMRSGTNIT